jgi:hypothetical protein
MQQVPSQACRQRCKQRKECTLNEELPDRGLQFVMLAPGHLTCIKSVAV